MGGSEGGDYETGGWNVVSEVTAGWEDVEQDGEGDVGLGWDETWERLLNWEEEEEERRLERIERLQLVEGVIRHIRVRLSAAREEQVHLEAGENGTEGERPGGGKDDPTREVRKVSRSVTDNYVPL